MQPLDLARDRLGLVVLVVRLDHDDGRPALAPGPELLLFPVGVVAYHRPRGVEDLLRAPVVLLELHDLRVRVVALEIEDVADVRAAPAEDALVVVADDREVLPEAGEVSQQNVLRSVGVLIFVDQDVLVALLPFLQSLIARLEQPADQQQEVVEVDRVVLAQQRVVALPDQRGDPVELISRHARYVGGTLELVLGGRDDGADRARREDALADALLGHRLADERALVALVVDGEGAVDPHQRPIAA